MLLFCCLVYFLLMLHGDLESFFNQPSIGWTKNKWRGAPHAHAEHEKLWHPAWWKSPHTDTAFPKWPDPWEPSCFQTCKCWLCLCKSRVAAHRASPAWGQEGAWQQVKHLQHELQLHCRCAPAALLQESPWEWETPTRTQHTLRAPAGGHYREKGTLV